MKQGFAVPLREEDHNWCDWIVGEVEFDGPNPPNLSRVIGTVTVASKGPYGEEEDTSGSIKVLNQALVAAGFTVTFIRDARLQWMDF